MNANANLDGTKSPNIPIHTADSQLPDQIIPVPFRPWPEIGYKPLPHALAGALLGGVAGCASLLANVIGSVFWPAIGGIEQHPLRIIQVYLTFPFGESALQLNSGSLLALGCLLYLITGMLYGMLFELVISYFLPHADLRARLTTFTILAIVVWIVNFYCVLTWLQPLLFGGRWIYELIPWWVAAATHLFFGWTMALLYPVNAVRKTEIDLRTRRSF